MSLPKFSFTSRAAPFISVGVGDTRTDIGIARWDVAHWGNPADATWSGAQPTWIDETCHGYSIEVATGRQRNTDTFAPATATIVLDNTDGWADETLLTLQPGRALRVGIKHETLGTVVLFRGVTDAVAQRYTPESGDTVEISAICMLGEVGRVKLEQLADPGVGGGENATVRMHRILDAAKFPGSHARDVQASSTTCTATRLGQQVADMFNIVAESVGGAVYGDIDGRVAFRGRDWQMFTPSPPDATIGNISAGDVCPSEYQLGHRRDDLITRCILARQNIDTEPVVFDDVGGQTLFGVETFQATDLVCQSAGQLNLIAARQFRVRGGSSSAQRIERVLLDTATSSDAVDLATTVSVFDPPTRLRCRLRLARGVVFDDEYLVTGIRHQMTPDTWTCDIDLDRAAPFEAAVAVWDTAHWGQDTWAPPMREAA